MFFGIILIFLLLTFNYHFTSFFSPPPIIITNNITPCGKPDTGRHTSYPRNGRSLLLLHFPNLFFHSSLNLHSSLLFRTTKPRGRQLLDHEAMTCLLVLLFVDEPKLNTGRLHRVLRYLCHHAPTRDWVIKVIVISLF